MLHVSANGARIPALGFGPWDLPHDRVQPLVEHALGDGYRHRNPAQMSIDDAAVVPACAPRGWSATRSFVGTDVLFLHPDYPKSSSSDDDPKGPRLGPQPGPYRPLGHGVELGAAVETPGEAGEVALAHASC